MRNIISLLLFFCCLCSFASTVPDSVIYVFGKAKNDSETRQYGGGGGNISLGTNEFSAPIYFSYTEGFKTEFVNKNFNDSFWAKTFEQSSTDFKKNSEYTIRFYYKFLKQNHFNTAVIEIKHIGASNIYIDGKLVEKFGTPSSNPDKEVCDVTDEPLYITKIDDSVHVIAIHYSNNNNYMSFSRGKKLSLAITSFDDYQNETYIFNSIYYFVIGLAAFFLALASVHFQLYISFSDNKYNLFYFIFLFALGLVGVIFISLLYTDNPAIYILLERINSFLVPVALCSLTILVFLIFKLKRNWYFYLVMVVYACFFLVNLFQLQDAKNLFYFLIFCIAYFGLTTISVVSIFKKRNGSKYLGLGIIGFTVFLILSIVFLVSFDTPIFGLICLTLSILSIPLFMSSFLSNQFATINKSLSEELKLNEELSKKTLQQEKEKKEILENQNKLLEEQVISRTIEITEQKKELQAKNIEITDSIAYSKHIQTALIPEENEITHYLKNSFVLYEPKDIVSGDFYWFKKNSETEFLFAAADCTGHGVPGALVSLIAIQSLNRATETENDVAQILKQTNNIIKNTLKQNDPNRAKDGMDIALCKIVFLQNGQISLSYAGANRPLWIIKKDTNEITEVKATKVAIGGFTEYNQDFGNNEFVFEPGDSIYLSSDGYADQFGSSKNKKLTTKRFKELLIKLNYLSGNLQKAELRKFITEWRGKLEQVDDILVVGLKF